MTEIANNIVFTNTSQTQALQEQKGARKKLVQSPLERAKKFTKDNLKSDSFVKKNKASNQANSDKKENVTQKMLLITGAIGAIVAGAYLLIKKGKTPEKIIETQDHNANLFKKLLENKNLKVEFEDMPSEGLRSAVISNKDGKPLRAVIYMVEKNPDTGEETLTKIQKYVFGPDGTYVQSKTDYVSDTYLQKIHYNNKEEQTSYLLTTNKGIVKVDFVPGTEIVDQTYFFDGLSLVEKNMHKKNINSNEVLEKIFYDKRSKGVSLTVKQITPEIELYTEYSSGNAESFYKNTKTNIIGPTIDSVRTTKGKKPRRYEKFGDESSNPKATEKQPPKSKTKKQPTIDPTALKRLGELNSADAQQTKAIIQEIQTHMENLATDEQSKVFEGFLSKLAKIPASKLKFENAFCVGRYSAENNIAFAKKIIEFAKKNPTFKPIIGKNLYEYKGQSIDELIAIRQALLQGKIGVSSNTTMFRLPWEQKESAQFILSAPTEKQTALRKLDLDLYLQNEISAKEASQIKMSAGYFYKNTPNAQEKLGMTLQEIEEKIDKVAMKKLT